MESLSTPATRPGTRRGFVARLATLVGGTSLGAGALASLGAQPPRRASKGASPTPAAAPQVGSQAAPLVHAEDAWLDTLPRGHRMVFDAFTLPGVLNAGRYCNNWIRSNESGYGLTPAQLGAVIILRAGATIFAFDDVIWSKYPLFGQQTRADPATGKPFAFNPFLRTPGGDALTQGVQWKELVELGVHFAVCNGTTTGLASAIASAAAGGNADAAAVEAVRQELAAHLLSNGHLMATGIVALGRAQEKGYTFGCGG